MYGKCPTCELLWNEFTEATKAHAAILRKFEVAVIEQDFSVASEFGPLKLTTAEERLKARIAVVEHDADHQDGNVKSHLIQGG